jgi:NAD(P)-dependent dehydrogenase (short-subunit alcohol dehydrogenase family)
MLNGRVAFITGASRGIGASLAVAFAQEGAVTMVGFCQNEALAQQVVDKIRNSDGQAETVYIDTGSRKSIQSAFAKIRTKAGEVSTLVNNAAISQEKPFHDITDEDWDHVQNINLRGAFGCCQEALLNMVADGYGRIINITSIGGQIGGVNQVHYAASKAGLISLTRSLARIYGKNNITVNAIAPGLVETDMTVKELQSEASRQKIEQIPLGRIASFNEIDKTAIFLASEGASYLTGQTLNVNGGVYFG